MLLPRYFQLIFRVLCLSLFMCCWGWINMEDVYCLLPCISTRDWWHAAKLVLPCVHLNIWHVHPESKLTWKPKNVGLEDNFTSNLQHFPIVLDTIGEEVLDASLGQTMEVYTLGSRAIPTTKTGTNGVVWCDLLGLVPKHSMYIYRWWFHPDGFLGADRVHLRVPGLRRTSAA